MFIKKPGHGRKSFALIGPDGKTIRDKRIEVINNDYRNGGVLEECFARLKLLIPEYKPIRVNHGFQTVSALNLKFVSDHHKAKLRRKVSLVDPDTLQRALVRAVKAIGTLSIQEASEEQLLTKLESLKGTQRYHVVRGLNELLRAANRPFRLFNPQPELIDEIVYITLSDFQTKIKLVRNENHRLYLTGLFATGCRWGELPKVFLRPAGAVDVRSQIDWDGNTRRTKNKRDRTAPVIVPLLDSLKSLIALPKDTVADIRLRQHSAILHSCKRHLGLNPHDLRHSYAVEWGSKGFSTAEIAKFIGDTPAVCERHYRNFCATDAEVQLALTRYRAASG